MRFSVPAALLDMLVPCMQFVQQHEQLPNHMFSNGIRIAFG